MLERFKFGSYRIEDTELAHSKKPKSKSVGQVLVKFLDSSQSNVKFNLDVSISKQVKMVIFYTLTQPYRKRPKAVICWTKLLRIWSSPNGTTLAWNSVMMMNTKWVTRRWRRNEPFVLSHRTIRQLNISSLTPFRTFLILAMAGSKQKRPKAMAEGAEKRCPFDADPGVPREVLCQRSEPPSGGVHPVSVLPANQTWHLDRPTACVTAHCLLARKLSSSM